MRLTIASLLEGYRSESLTPSGIVDELLSQSDAGSYAATWIHRLDAGALRLRARQLEERMIADPRAIDHLPLFGIPYAVKDNIDVAGLPTTAACAEFSYVADRSATVVEKLEAAGAMLVGKTNLDQFATGLVGTRSPYGIVPNAFLPDWISGGSSSGSAVAVSRGRVSFALGTDTAGSGRVPAGLNNIVGLKPTRGLVSARGVVPACQSLDCVSLFALSVPDAIAVLDVVRGPDTDDPYSRPVALWPDACPTEVRVAIPEPLEFYGDDETRRAFDRALELLDACGARRSQFDIAPFLEAAALLYEGPWVAERMAAIRSFFDGHAGAMHPVVREIIGGAAKYDATDLFQGERRLAELRKVTARVWESTDVLVVPTAPTAYRIAEVLADPFRTNRRLGYYTNFVNLLDQAALAVPSAIRTAGLPFGITLIGPAGSDRMLADLGQRFHQRTALKLGALDEPLPPPVALPRGHDGVSVAVVGAHLRGLPLNGELLERGARLERTARTSVGYRLVALPGTTPPKPGLVRDAAAAGAIEVEVWRMPATTFGSFVAGIASPLGIGSIELDDGDHVQGFLCESWATAGATDITRFGGWRAYLKAQAR